MRGALHHVHPLHPSHVLARPQKAHEAIVARQRRGRHEGSRSWLRKGSLGVRKGSIDRRSSLSEGRRPVSNPRTRFVGTCPAEDILGQEGRARVRIT